MRFSELIRDFSEDDFGRMVDDLNTGLSKLELEHNMNGEVVEVVLPADGTEVEVPHSLKTVPKYRIIVRQNGCGIVVDGVKEWTERYIYLKLCVQQTAPTTVGFNDKYGDPAFGASTPNSINIPALNIANDEVTAKVLIMRG